MILKIPWSHDVWTECSKLTKIQIPRISWIQTHSYDVPVVLILQKRERKLEYCWAPQVVAIKVILTESVLKSVMVLKVLTEWLIWNSGLIRNLSKLWLEMWCKVTWPYLMSNLKSVCYNNKKVVIMILLFFRTFHTTPDWKKVGVKHKFIRFLYDRLLRFSSKAWSHDQVLLSSSPSPVSLARCNHSNIRYS